MSAQTVTPLKYWIRLFLRHWYWFALGLAVASAGAIYHTRYSNPVYKIGGNILVNTGQQMSTSEQAILDELGYSSKADVADQVQYLKSTYLMRRVVDALSLHIRYRQHGRLKVNEQYRPIALELLHPTLSPALYGHVLWVETLDAERFVLVDAAGMRHSAAFGDTLVVDGLQVLIHPGAEPNVASTYEVTINAPKATARALADALQVRQVERSNVIHIAITDEAPERAEAMLRALVDAYNASVLERKQQAGNNTLAFIDERLRYIAQELYDVERDVEQFRRSRKLPLEVSAQAGAYLDKITGVDRLMMEVDLQQAVLETLLGALDKPDQPFPDASTMAPEALGQLIRQYNELLFRRQNALESATARNPAVATLEEQLEYLRRGVRNGVANMQRELESKRRTLEEQLRPLERQISAVPGTERELLQIMRQQKIKETLFLFLLQKREETALNIAAQTNDAFLLDEPENRGPVSPGAGRVWLFAAVLGLALPAAALFLREQLDDRLRTRSDIEAHTRIPFLGQLAQAGGKAQVVVESESRSAVAEMFRLLRTNLQFNAAGSPDQVLLITSTASGEGKSFTALNLAVSQALLGKKTALVGFDLRRPRVVQYLMGQRLDPGITTYLLGRAEASELPRQVPDHPNLYGIDSGPVPPNPAELLQHERVQHLFEYLRRHFEYIIVDTAPVGLVTDALLLAPYADHTLLVTRYGMTTAESIQHLDELHRSGKLVRPGIVLNGVRSFGRYGYGSGYGYGSDYYGAERKRWWRR